MVLQCIIFIPVPLTCLCYSSHWFDQHAHGSKGLLLEPFRFRLQAALPGPPMPSVVCGYMARSAVPLFMPKSLCKSWINTIWSCQFPIIQFIFFLPSTMTSNRKLVLQHFSLKKQHFGMKTSLTSMGFSFFITALSSLSSFHTLFSRHTDSVAGSWWAEKGFTATFYVFCKSVPKIFFLGSCCTVV